MPRQCLAVAVVAALDSLIDAIEHCCAHLDNLASRRGISKRDPNDVPF